MVWSAEIEAFVEAHIRDDVRRLALQNSALKGEELRAALMQIELRQRMLDKLPTIATTKGIFFASRLSTEQCSSEMTAAYKQKIIGSGYKNGVDMTAGMGIDTIFMARACEKMAYIERDRALAEAARHNMRLLAQNVEIRQMTAEEWLDASDEQYDFGFIDPARRGTKGERVYGMGDCEPDVRKLRPRMLERCRKVLVKLSPMIDIKECIDELSPTQVHVVSVNNECKEVLALLETERVGECKVTAVELSREIEMQFQFSDEMRCMPVYAERVERGMMLGEPYAAMMKAGAWRLMAERYGARMVAANSHLYVGERMTDFPGRRFVVTEVSEFTKRDAQRMLAGQANLAVRNFPATVAELRRKYRCADGGERYLFLTTDNWGRKLIIECKKL